MDRKQIAASSLIKKICDSRKRRMLLTQIGILLTQLSHLKLKKVSALFLCYMQNNSQSSYVLPRVRRFIRNQGWFHTLWTEYSGKRFKQTIRVSKATFNYILLHIRDGLERRSVC